MDSHTARQRAEALLVAERDCGAEELRHIHGAVCMHVQVIALPTLYHPPHQNAVASLQACRHGSWRSWFGVEQLMLPDVQMLQLYCEGVIEVPFCVFPTARQLQLQRALQWAGFAVYS